ncbi:peroxiredoxin [Burkholderia vietnamiensis]|uniref:peroxiredoxin n=1 Tax=Burkholderia vietnamiensis TaxID=60552 RepID=UPI001CF1AEB3|nr:peroxiredoxin [Burkholderia vietnamiensis]MCA8452016.1 peroxiredoxin [Burkholderia vietnamiensis]HDR8954931.1 peroxiredoxin [Burkholderia vietnamiensis]
MIQVGEALPEALPDAQLFEYVDDAREGCTLGPNAVSVREQVAGKRVVIFGLPGAFTPTCSAQHVPGYVEHAEQLRAAGIDELWCVSVNDAFVMGAWGRDLHTAGKVRMIADGSAAFTHALGLTQDLSARGMGIRSLRYAMVVDDGVVKTLAVEAPGKFEVSDAASVLATLRP